MNDKISNLIKQKKQIEILKSLKYALIYRNKGLKLLKLTTINMRPSLTV